MSDGVICHGARAFLDISRVDLLWIAVLVTLTFALRAASPIYPDVLTHPFAGVPVHAASMAAADTRDACQPDVPVGPGGAPERRCGFVFDEVYFPVDAAKDLHQPALDYFDPEPPLTKLLMAPPIAAWGFTRWAWRFSPALFGSLLVGLIYLIARRLRDDRFFAVVAALFVCLDGLAFVESRIGVIDVIAVFFVVATYYAFLLHWQARTARQWRVTLYLTAMEAGLALAAKLTALAPLAVIALLSAARFAEPWLAQALPWARSLGQQGSSVAGRLWRQGAGRVAIAHYAVALVVVATIFVASFSRYSTISHSVPQYTGCTQSGGPSGGPATTEASSLTVSRERLHSDVPLMVANVVDVTRASFRYHLNECRPHPYASRWYTWPVLWHPVLFFYDEKSFVTQAGSAKVGSIANTGNPALWWIGLAGLLFCLLAATAGTAQGWRLGLSALGVGSLAVMILAFHVNEHPDYDTVKVAPGVLFDIAGAGLAAFGAGLGVAATVSRRMVPAFILLGYLVGWLMWAPGNEQRVLFLYHMLGALPFLALGLAYGLTALRRIEFELHGHRLRLAPVAYATVAVVVAAFVFFYPIWTGQPEFLADRQLRIWLPGW